MTCGIYKITNIFNGKCYVGLSGDVDSRWDFYRKMIACKGLNKAGSVIWVTPVQMFEECRKLNLNVDSFEFELLEKCAPENLANREGYWLSLLKPAYNVGHKVNSRGVHRAVETARSANGLADLRERQGLSIVDIACHLQVAESTIRNWEHGRSIPKLTFEQTESLMKLYGCSIAELREAFQETKRTTSAA